LAIRSLLAAHPECDLLICDDGLQHYALARDVEIAVGGLRSLGNGRLLPAGPLRERPSRLQEVDMVVASAEQALPDEFCMRLIGHTFRNLQDPARTAQPQDFAGRELHAVAGIGQPQRFYGTLQALGLKCTPHSFPDHYPYRPSDLQFEAFAVVLMTEKDAVKCAGFAQADWWYLEVDAQLDDGVGALVLNKIRS
jgi:tetraacyldisaccharide 4'-kinase